MSDLQIGDDHCPSCGRMPEREPGYDPDDVRDLAELAKLEALEIERLKAENARLRQRTPGAVTLSPNSFAELEAVLRERDALREEIERLRVGAERVRMDRVIPLARFLHDVAGAAGVSDIGSPAEVSAEIRAAIEATRAQRDALADALEPVYGECACSHRYLSERGVPIPKKRTAWLSAAETALRGAGRLQKEES